jgi:hypothetical protein
MSTCIARTVFVLSIFVTASAVAQESDVKQARAEVALSNDTLQMRYLGSGAAAGVEGSRISGTFFLSEQRDIVLNGALLFPADIDVGIGALSSADSLTDLSARVEMNVAPRLTAFGGMRWFEFDLTEGGGKRTLQEELFVGAGYRF